jgi:hypothetical protein
MLVSMARGSVRHDRDPIALSHYAFFYPSRLDLLTALIYIIARGGGMAERQRAAMQRAKSQPPMPIAWRSRAVAA